MLKPLSKIPQLPVAQALIKCLPSFTTFDLVNIIISYKWAKSSVIEKDSKKEDNIPILSSL